MWLKLLLCGLAIAFCALLGKFAAGKYHARKCFFSQLCDLNERFLSELKYRRTPLPDFLKTCELTGDFRKIVQAPAESEIKLSYLTDTEKADVRNYLLQLGRGDSVSQLGFFENRRTSLLEQKERTAKEAKEREELYFKLGLLAGLAFVILIV